MKTKFQILDSDYIIVNSKPYIRFFGRNDKDRSITVFYDKFLPYFYILPEEGKMEELKEYILEKFKDIVVRFKTVEKFLPIGYHGNKTKILKVTLNDPSKTPFIRDSLRKIRLVKEIYEADILFRYRFMADHNISGMRWYRVEGNNTRTNTVKTEKKFEAEKFEEIEVDENTKFKYMSLDIETISSEGGLPDAEKDQIIIISMFFYPSFRNKNSLILTAKTLKKFDDDILSFPSEKEMLSEFLRIVDQFDPDFICGYNITNFDLPFIETRLRKRNLPRTLGRCNQKSIRSSKFANRYRVTIPGRVVVDVYSLIKEATKKFGLFKGLKRYGLDDVSKLILGEGKVDIAHSEINTIWTTNNDERLKKLIEYSRTDAELPMKILLKERMLDKFLEISKLTGIVPQDALDSGETSRIENLLLREFNKRNFLVPCKPTNEEVSRRNIERRSKGLKGAFVLKPDMGFYDTCVVYLDFRSMYPSIFINLNICPTTLLLEEKNLEHNITPFGSKFVSKTIREGIIPKILDYLLEARAKIKKEMKKAKDPKKKNYLYAKQYAFKTVANALYGYSGYIRARLYILDIANGITSTGREMIKKTKKIVETKTPYKVIYGDTDSIMVKLDTRDLEKAFKTGEELAELINEDIHILQMKIESVFKSLIILAKKRYAGWSFEPMDGSWEESIITKGIETVRRDWCDLVSETLEKVLETILKEQNVKKAVKIVKNTTDDIKSGRMDIDKLIITKGISRSIKSYKGIQPHVELVKKMRKRDPSTAPGVGDRVGFVIVKGTQLISQRTEDPEYVKKHGLKIDSKYYIESQLLPPLERVFEALNVNKSELMGVGKQLGILEAMKNGIKEEKQFEDYLTEIDGFICNNCNNVFKRVPLIGKCNYCNGEIVFFKQDKKSRMYNPWQQSM